MTKKYRKLAAKYHPDINKDEDATEKDTTNNCKDIII
ncbi:MAG: DnaJ domain-containing protein [Clostridium sp.]|nr:MAG: DnaJ domain-containing protein [Clostridium sp.]